MLSTWHRLRARPQRLLTSRLSGAAGSGQCGRLPSSLAEAAVPPISGGVRCVARAWLVRTEPGGTRSTAPMRADSAPIAGGARTGHGSRPPSHLSVRRLRTGHTPFGPTAISLDGQCPQMGAVSLSAAPSPARPATVRLLSATPTSMRSTTTGNPRNRHATGASRCSLYHYDRWPTSSTRSTPSVHEPSFSFSRPSATGR